MYFAVELARRKSLDVVYMRANDAVRSRDAQCNCAEF